MKMYIRSMICAEPGNILISCDLSQAESWIVAYLAGEVNMKHALQFGDIHTETAGNALFFANTGCHHGWTVRVKGEEWICLACEHVVTKLMRYVGKRYNHASAYRMGAERAAQVINKDSDKPPYFTVTIKQSRTFSSSWHSYYNLGPWWSEIEGELAINRALRTPYGRKRTFFAAWGNELFKEATAYVPQSTVADHFNGAVHPELGVVGGLTEIRDQLVAPYPQHRIINQSHDSAILEVPKSSGLEIADRVKKLLLRPLVIKDETFTIPVDAEWGERWGEMERVPL